MHSLRLLLSTSLIAVASAASAADMPIAQRFPAPAPFSWTGFYVGANIGYASVNTTTNTDGVIGGGQIGANWQTGSVVLGVEADLQAADLSARTTATFGGLTVTETTTADWIGTVRGRLGWAFDRFMIYGTGGAAFTSLDHNGLATGTAVGGYSASNSLNGWVAGAGLEWAAWDRWSVKLEYLHMEFDRHTNTYATTPAIFVSYADIDVDVVRVGVNYRFR